MNVRSSDPQPAAALNEADTCRRFVVPKLQAAGWDNEPHSITEQRYFTDGRIVVRGNRAERKRGKKADYLLRYTRDFPIAVVEAKAIYRRAVDGLQQAKEYALMLGLKFAFASNGEEIIEFDFATGLERTVAAFPTPSDLWARLRKAEKLGDDLAAQRLLTPANPTTGKDPRYYQQIAINRTREILNDLLEKYAIDGELQFTLPDVLKVAPIWRHGNVAEIVRKFGGAEELRSAVNQLQALLYAP